jgi:predicted TPR repeat methyltransferase
MMKCLHARWIINCHFTQPTLLRRRASGQGTVLDVGAGTGLVAQRLVEHGIAPIDGTDISPEMLEVARGKALYRDLFVSDITAPLDIPTGRYQGIISAGTFTLGHVGPDALDGLIRIAAPGAQFAITINGEHFDSAGFALKFEALATTITGLVLQPVRYYGQGAQGDHAMDEGKIALFRKA